MFQWGIAGGADGYDECDEFSREVALFESGAEVDGDEKCRFPDSFEFGI